MKNDPLKVVIIDDKLVISVGVSTLCEAVEQDCQNWQIMNHENFVKDFMRALVKPDEKGGSILTNAFIKAADNAFIKENKKDEDEWWVVKNK